MANYLLRMRIVAGGHGKVSVRSDDVRLLLRDRDELEMSLAEIADRLGTTKQTVHRIQQRALAKLRAALEDVDKPATNLMRPGCTQTQKR